MGVSSSAHGGPYPKACLAFYTNQLGERGTEVSLFDYAHFAERLLGTGMPLILYERDSPANFPGTVRKFRERFGHARVVGVQIWPQHVPPSSGSWWERTLWWLRAPARPLAPKLDQVLNGAGVTSLYLQKAGDADGVVSTLPHVRNLVHAVFWAATPHGTV